MGIHLQPTMKTQHSSNAPIEPIIKGQAVTRLAKSKETIQKATDELDLKFKDRIRIGMYILQTFISGKMSIWDPWREIQSMFSKTR